ncbi:doxx family protein [Bacillus sp. OxB-1]|nr:doxx family protein [Bacillus sp. OxB-1]
MKEKTIIMPENPVSHFLFNDTRSGLIWLIIRIYVGYPGSWPVGGK